MTVKNRYKQKVSLKIICGLGNYSPLGQFDNTYHNLGFYFTEWLCSCSQGQWRDTSKFTYAQITVNNQNIILCKPKTFMNTCGSAVAHALNYFQFFLEDLLVVHDDLTTQQYDFKIKNGGSAQGHNGVRSIVSHVGCNEFRRLKIGIGHPGPGKVQEYVLKKVNLQSYIPLFDTIYELL